MRSMRTRFAALPYNYSATASYSSLASLSSEFKHCMFFRFRVNGGTGQTDGQTDRRTDGWMDRWTAYNETLPICLPFKVYCKLS